MSKEIWKDVVGFESCYSISNFGNIKSKDRYSKPYKNGQCHLITGKVRKPSIKNGYYFCWLQNQEGVRYMQYIHRLVAQTFVTNKNNLPVIDHIDGNKLNNSYKNLRWCTVSKNNLNTDKRKGYFFNKKNNRFYSRIKHQGKAKILGSHSSAKEATDLYQKSKDKLITEIK